MNYFKPDFYFENYLNINVEWLKQKGIKFILSDIDSTLAPHNKMGDESLNSWLNKLREEEIEVICVSNNSKDRAINFGKNHNLVAIGECRKPQIKRINIFLQSRGIKKENVVLMGDQLFTDVWCGKRLGVKTILVLPIGNYQPIGIRVKRVLEKKLIRKWKMR